VVAQVSSKQVKKRLIGKFLHARTHSPAAPGTQGAPMGREIRRVPANWQHPRNGQGHYLPLYDKDYVTAAQEWLDEVRQWDDGTHEDLRGRPELKQQYPFFWDWSNGPPDKEAYRVDAWTPDQATHYQVYETVSEGTPTSPVFASLDDLESWLVQEGYSETAAKNFARTGWVPSMVIADGRLYSGVDAAVLFGQKDHS
jgi:hypothetical protein